MRQRRRRIVTGEVPFALGDRLGHHLRLRARDDRLDRFGNCRRHQSGSRTQRGARGEDRGAGFSAAAGDYDRMPEISLVRIDRARLQMGTCVAGLIEPSARRNLANRLGRKSDLRDRKLSAMFRTRIGNVPELRVTEGDRERGAHRRAHDRAVVGIDARRDIDRHDRRAERVHPLDRGARNSAYRSVKPGAENSIDDRARPRPVCRIQIGFFRRLHDHAARADQFVMRTQRVALQIAAPSEQRDPNLNSALAKPPRRDHRVAAVVAFAAYGEHTGASRVGEVIEKLIGNRLARSGHERIRIDAVFFLAEPIEFAAFGSGEKNHRGTLDGDLSKAASAPHRATKAPLPLSRCARREILVWPCPSQRDMKRPAARDFSLRSK